MVFLFIVLAASLIGFAGKGPLSKGAAESSSGRFTIEYHKIARFSSPLDLKISINPELLTGDTVKIKLKKEYLREIEIQRIIPMPVEESMEYDNIVFSFLSGESETLSEIIYFYHFNSAGNISSEISLNNDKVSFGQFVFP